MSRSVAAAAAPAGPAVAARAARVSVLVCRGCCCGTSKHPDVDHPAQTDTLRRALPSHVRSRLFESDCLGPCDRSNVVVVSRDGRRRWFGGVLAVDQTRALADWIGTGADGPPPAEVGVLEFVPDRTDAESVADTPSVTSGS